MALARIARSGFRRSGGALGGYSLQNNTFCEGVPAFKYSLPSLENVSPHSNLSYLFNIRKASSLGNWSRGIRTTPHFQSQNAERIVEESESEYEETRYAGLEATKPGEKPRVVFIGTGWGACQFLKGLYTKIYDVVCISPRDHMVITPFLASTCVGTLEFRSVAENVSQSSCTGIVPDKHEVAERQGGLFDKKIGRQYGSKAFSDPIPQRIVDGTNNEIVRPLSPHLPIYKPQLNSTSSILNRISGAYLAGIILFYYLLYLKMGSICFTYYGFYQFLFYSSKLDLIFLELSALALSYHLFKGVGHLWTDFSAFTKNKRGRKHF
ncbi:hypothetical protein Pint_10533 [Pistacia integerrima]|uniref:Uncharacterized protein n=1 Tax=Pistacia integerrima TaxID=434235 RepID=A0ACC0XLJ0_9ROSI|nr:hypothetical protein Pint_10533 [Pistacia integerrima]